MHVSLDVKMFIAFLKMILFDKEKCEIFTKVISFLSDFKMKIFRLLLQMFIAYLAACMKYSSAKRSTFRKTLLSEQAIKEELIEGSTRFSFDLLRALNSNLTSLKDSKDLFFSPYGVWSALVVTYMGSRGNTKQEMKKVLGIREISKAETWRAFKSLRYCNPLNKRINTNFNYANRIYFQKGTALRKYIQKMLYKNVAFVDFRNHAEQARKIINTWVEHFTNRRIRNLIPPRSINKMTKMVIANAVYFKEKWLQPFEPQNTSRRKFITSSLKTIFVPMMSTKGMFLHGKNYDLHCSVLEIPYSDNGMSMMILLPNKVLYGVENLVNQLNPTTLRNLQESMLPREVLVSIPKFKVEDTYELSRILSKMGLKTLFDKKRVNLSGFTGSKEFVVDSIRHKTLVDVNEVGTEAAASTGMFYYRSAAPSGRVVFTADHPFVYLILDNSSNTILFLGTVRQPHER